ELDFKEKWRRATIWGDIHWIRTNILMKQQVIKTVRWSLIGFCIVIAAPFILGKMNVYSPLQAESIAEPIKKDQPQVTAVPIGFQVFSYADAVEKAAPAVVSIKTTKEVAISAHPFMQDPFFRHFFADPNMMEPDSREQQGLGSGVIVSEKGHILTNNHV